MDESSSLPWFSFRAKEEAVEIPQLQHVEAWTLGRALCTGTGPGLDPSHKGGEGVVGRRESDSQVTCHPNWMHAAMWHGQTRHVSNTSEPPPPTTTTPLPHPLQPPNNYTPHLQKSVPTLNPGANHSSGEHVHFCCITVFLLNLFFMKRVCSQS